MAYSKTTWVNGGSPPVNATNLNKIEQGIYDAHNIDLSSYAPKVSPALTGTPTAPTAASGTKTTQVATTEFANSLLASYTVTGSAVTSIDFSGLDINTHKSYRVECRFINATSSGAEISIFANNNTTQSNYYREYYDFSGALISGNRQNVAYYSYIPAGVGNTSESIINIMRDVNDLFSVIASTNRDTPSNITMTLFVGSSTVGFGNITQLTFTASVANAIGVGSTIRIYRSDV